MIATVQPEGSPLGTRILRGLAVLLVLAYFVAGFGYLALRYLVWPNTAMWLPRVEAALEAATGQPLEIGTVRAGFEGLRPAIDIDRLAVLHRGGEPAFSVERVRATISLSHLLLGQFRLAGFEAHAPLVRIDRRSHQRLEVGGYAIDLAGTGAESSAPGDEGAATGTQQALAWLLSQRSIVLRNVAIDWHDHVEGRSIRLDGTDLVLGSVGRRHRLALKVPRISGVADDLALSVELRRPPFSSLSGWQRWSGSAHLSVGRAQLPALRALVPKGWAIEAALPDVERGEAALRVWLELDDGMPLDALLKVAVVDASLRLPTGPLDLVAGDAQAVMQRERDGSLQLRVSHLALDDAEGRLVRLAPDALQRLSLDAGGRIARGEFVLDGFDAPRLLAFARQLPWPQALAARLAEIRTNGRVQRMAVAWNGPMRYSVDAEVDGLSLARDSGPTPAGSLGLPSFRNLSGTVGFNEAGGRLAATGRKAALVFPGLFAEPEVPLEALDARVSWQRRASDTVVEIERLRFAAVDAAGEMTGRYTTGGKGVGLVDFEGRLTRADATRVHRYLPLEIPASVRDWVRGAIRGGRSDDVRFVLRGDLYDFPYREPGSGLFRIDAALTDATLAYAPDWPVIDRIRGRLVFEGAGMDIDARSARLWGVNLGRTRAVIDEYREGLLRIEGSGVGPAQDMMRFIDESPLRNRVGDFVRAIAVDGAAKLELALRIPLDEVDATKVAGTVRFDGNRVKIDPELPAFTEVGGRLEFTEQALRLRELAGNFLGGPIRVDGQTPGAGRFQIDASGRASAAGVRSLTDNPLTAALDGSADWRARIDVGEAGMAMTIDSELEGLSLRLPAPIAKEASMRWPLRIETRPTAGGDRLTITLDEEIRLAFDRRRERAGDALRVRRGVFALGAEPRMPDAGFAVRLAAPQVDVDAWFAVLGPSLAAEREAERGRAGGAFSLLPTEVSLQAGVMQVVGKTLNGVGVNARRSEGVWRADVRARELDGSFSWRASAPGEPVGTLTARFRRLEIPAGRGDDVASLIDDAPRRLPALDIAADEFVLNERRLGRLALRAVNAGGEGAQVWQLESLTLENAGARLQARGEWRVPRAGERRGMALDIDLAIADAGRLLDVFGYQGTMRAGAGSLRGRLAWTGSPFAIDYPSLGGELSLALGQGEFLKTDPGIAKLIGVLNLQSLRRRLAFDFRDLFSEGFAFDEISASARISKGLATTDDFSMRGVTAQVRLSGEANLAAETQNLLVEVRPELNAGLASLAYAALANPAIGLGTFIAQWLLREPLREMFAWQYQVTGSWGEPQVEIRSRPTIDAQPQGG